MAQFEDSNYRRSYQTARAPSSAINNSSPILLAVSANDQQPPKRVSRAPLTAVVYKGDSLNIPDHIRVQSPFQPATLQSAPLQSFQHAPLQPAPLQSAPLRSASLQSAPLQSAPLQSAPVQPTPVQPTPSQPAQPQPAPLQTSLRPMAQLQQRPLRQFQQMPPDIFFRAEQPPTAPHEPYEQPHRPYEQPPTPYEQPPTPYQQQLYMQISGELPPLISPTSSTSLSSSSSDASVRPSKHNHSAQQPRKKYASSVTVTTANPQRQPSAARRFKCDLCDKSYTRKHNLVAHKLSVHTNEKPFTCSVCKAKFKRESGLTRHVREQHTDAGKTYVCSGVNPDGTHWGCGKRFFREDQFKSHLSTQKAGFKCLKNMTPGVHTELTGIVVVKREAPE